ncbi:GumC family protein [Sediminibacterium ginsengisoli]|uniref:Chromosome partitioning ATPase, Mrp family, contains Fe-S cluster n=1 Tax=Sediminibacterium ginsengisoli TaxID=413434 RepID=A0A1T4RM53_9BACT|nr:hypothetical protein [Sediminibacterium ginsengisoli]SKA17080.1 Chromosome partitioning ATPase, Mrp family, contains Fe-S cluster [Sediminibacterium ginsengisoli]
MEVNKFLRILSRQKFTLIAVPLITVIITYFLVRESPNVYISKARIATGLVEQSDKASLGSLAFLQESKIDQEFANILQAMQLKKIYNQLSYKLMLHDLLHPDSAFRKPSKLLGQLNVAARRHAIEVYSRLYEKSEPLVLWDPDQNGLYQVLSSMGYDEQSLKNKMFIYRVNKSDFIDVEFQSENPLLSAYVVNNLCSEFISYYTTVTRTNTVKSVSFLDSLQKRKQAAVNEKMTQLKNYKIENRILNLEEQSKVLYTQIADMETKLEVSMKDIDAYKGALKDIDAKLSPKERQYLESATSRINQDIVASTNQLKSLNDLYIRSNYDPIYKGRIDSLRNQISAQISESSDRYTLSPLTSKGNLLVQKLNAEVALNLAKFSINSLRDEIKRLNDRVTVLVPHEAMIQAFESEIDVAGKEYLDALDKFNQSSLSSNLAVQIRQIETGMPGGPEPSKKMLLVILSAVISFAFCVLILFVIFYFDDNLKTVQELADKTDLPVLGYLPFLGNTVIDLRKMWNGEYNATRTDEYKNLIRTIRFEVGEEMKDAASLAITSMKPGEGKTFAAFNIMYAYSRAGKKVLLIDGDFDGHSISDTVQTQYYLEDYLNGLVSAAQLGTDKHITVLGNKGGDPSLFEIASEEVVKQKMAALRTHFDVILVDIPSLKEMGKSHEWIAVTDKFLAVFETDQSISPAKQLHVDYLKQHHNKFIGWILNKVVTGKGRRNKEVAL